MKNAEKPLPLSLKIGNENITQFTHPSVIDFKIEHHIDSWAGYRYWMVLTPYPYSNDRYENPSLCASQDGIHWECPNKISNPLDTAEGGWDKGFHSDPEMIYNPDTDELWIYYRYLTHERYQMKLLRIKQDLIIRNPTIIMDHSPWNKHFELKSMAIVREASNKWHMWGGSRNGHDKLEAETANNSLYLSSNDGINWSEPRFCYNKEGIDPYYAIGFSNWHTSCKYNPYTNKVDFLCYCYSIKCSEKDKIIYASCTLDSPWILSCPKNGGVLESPNAGWDSFNLYRCAFVIEAVNDKLLYHVWYTGRNKINKIQQCVQRFCDIINKYLKLLRPVIRMIPKFAYQYMWRIGYTKGEIVNQKEMDGIFND